MKNMNRNQITDHEYDTTLFIDDYASSFNVNLYDSFFSLLIMMKSMGIICEMSQDEVTLSIFKEDITKVVQISMSSYNLYKI